MRKADTQHSCGLTLNAIIWSLLIACNGVCQEHPPTGKVSTEFSQVYNFVDKSEVVGHQQAFEGKLKSGELYQNGAHQILQSNNGIKLFSKMLVAVGVANEQVIYCDIWVVPE